MFIPKWLLFPVAALLLLLIAWAGLMAAGRNPLPFPDHGSRIFVAASPEAKDAVVALLARHGVTERFQVDSAQVQRSILWDGTIVNHSSPELLGKLGAVTSAIGLVADDPLASAEAAAAFLRARGFTAQVVEDVEPGFPVVFVLSDVMPGTALNFRRHVIHMPRPAPAP